MTALLVMLLLSKPPHKDKLPKPEEARPVWATWQASNCAASRWLEAEAARAYCACVAAGARRQRCLKEVAGEDR